MEMRYKKVTHLDPQWRSCGVTSLLRLAHHFKKLFKEVYMDAADVVAKSRHCIVFTGAGVSAESGVPTFRGARGLWERYRPEELATPEAFAKDPRARVEVVQVAAGVGA